MTIDTTYVDYNKSKKERIKDYIHTFLDTKWGNIPNAVREELEEELYNIYDEDCYFDGDDESIDENYNVEFEEQDYYYDDDDDDNNDDNGYDDYGYYYDSFQNLSWDFGYESDYDDDDDDVDDDYFDDFDYLIEYEAEKKAEEEQRAEEYKKKFRGTKWGVPRNLKREYEEELY